MGAKQQGIVPYGIAAFISLLFASRDEEGVLHFAGRMLGREVQGLENVPVILNLRSLCHVVAEFAEDVHDFLSYYGNGVAAAKVVLAAGHGKVLFRCPFCCGAVILYNFPQFFYFCGGGVLELVHQLAELLFLVGRYAAELFEQFCDCAFFAQKSYSGLFKFLSCSGSGGCNLLHQGVDSALIHYFFFLSFMPACLALRFSLSLITLWPPCLRYSAHCPAEKYF